MSVTGKKKLFQTCIDSELCTSMIGNICHHVACVASVSAGFQSKKSPKNGISKFWPRENWDESNLPREKWGESKNERAGRGRGRKETLADKPQDFENIVRWLGSSHILTCVVQRSTERRRVRRKH